MDHRMLYEIALDCRLNDFKPLLKKLRLKKYQKNQLIARMKQRMRVFE
jgi:hypothetical protein